MRLKISESKNASSLYVIKSTYKDGKHSSKIVEKLGTYDAIQKKLDGGDPIAWAKKYIEELNRLEEEKIQTINVQYSPVKQILKDDQLCFDGGYLFLQKIYHELGLHKICKAITNRYRFEFNLDAVLSRLLYGRILFPASKRSTCHLSEKMLEPADFQLQHVYRALGVIAEETNFIQARLYKNSAAKGSRNNSILYYDCTNYFFEIEEANGLRQYGMSKEHRPNPIVQMGMFIDGDGIPLAFNIQPGNTNEQITLQPLEQEIMENFKMKKFVVCTDAGLASTANRKFNDKNNRRFITTQSVKVMKKYQKEWALSASGWRLPDSSLQYDISELEESEESAKKYKDVVFYKERWMKENGLEQRFIITFSLKYKNYQRRIRDVQIARAQKLIDSNPSRLSEKNQNDYRRFVSATGVTKDGEVADKNLYALNESAIAKESQYDGFYAVATNLEDSASEIIRINHQRWEIEDCFRVMKTEFKARPVFLSRDDRIKAHFTTCFLALTIFRYLEKKLNFQFTGCRIIKELRNMKFLEAPGDGYIPTYTRTDVTDALHDVSGFRTDFQIITHANMRKIFKATKS